MNNEPIYNKEVEEGLAPATNEGKRPLLHINLSPGNIRTWLPFTLFLAGLFIVFVWNRYQVENLVRRKAELEKEIVILRERGIQRQMDYQDCIKISRIATELDSIGVQFISGPPYEIAR
mgnify:CR=1 FL=1